MRQGARSCSGPCTTVPTTVQAFSSQAAECCSPSPALSLVGSSDQAMEGSDAGLCLLSLRVFSLLSPAAISHYLGALGWLTSGI